MQDEPHDQRALLPDEAQGRENVVVLYLVQAMLGLLSPTVLAVAAEVRRDGLIVHFALEQLGDAERDDVEDILADLDALLENEKDLPTAWKIEPSLHVGSPDATWPGRPHRRVYESKAARA